MKGGSYRFRRWLASILAVCGLCVPALASAAPGDPLLPDLIIWADANRQYLHGWVIDTNQIPGRILLRLTSAIPNIGTGPMELVGGTTYPDGTQDVYQRIYLEGGGSTDRLAGTFTFHETHGHIHFDDFTEFNLRQVTAGNGVGLVLAGGDKVSFCLLDLAAYNLSLPGAPQSAHYTQCGQWQGISVGWSDVYLKTLPDQWIDITAVPNGSYWLEVVADPEDHLLEADETNNATRILITLTNQPAIHPRGEVNGDLRVSGADSLLINQVLVGLRATNSAAFGPAGYANGDVDGMNAVTGADSLLINQTMVALRPYLVTGILPAARSNTVATNVRIYGVGFPTNDTPTVRIGAPVNLLLTNVVVLNREQIAARVPVGGGLGTGAVHVLYASTNGVLSFGQFINR